MSFMLSLHVDSQEDAAETAFNSLKARYDVHQVQQTQQQQSRAGPDLHAVDETIKWVVEMQH
ncbi:hypothetical protein TSUD_193670 [Trifolium subterraneum]|uniref:Uncharacterized protein n=1 Tax=Trifolium subterraneum TaxID=3900 RepID=A0A2Z6LM00_TRISU|nr:hypothetical protein TSUD_193670 [Trifolium subterraneum]